MFASFLGYPIQNKLFTHDMHYISTQIKRIRAGVCSLPLSAVRVPHVQVRLDGSFPPSAYLVARIRKV